MQPVPTINVNLTTCKCAGAPEDADPLRDASGHIREFNGRPYCAAAPVLLPCPIPPSVTFEVRLGACNCPEPERMTAWHDPDCPARPVRVSCFLDGQTWEGSEVGEIDVHESQNPAAHDTERILAACRERWALVKALVLGFTRVTLGGISRPQADKLFAQRDAVFAALADMARAESVHTEKHRAMFTVLSDAGVSWSTSFRVRPSEAESGLAAYVERLIEQVGVLP